MSTALVRYNPKSVNTSYTFQGDPVMKLNPGLLKDFTFAAQNPTITAPVAGNSTSATIQFLDPSPMQNGPIWDIIFEQDVPMSGSADGSLTYPNPYLIYDNIIIQLNGVEIDNLHNQAEIRCRYSDFLRSVQGSPNREYASLQMFLPFTGTTLPGLVYAQTGTTNVRLSLLPLFPYLRYFNTTLLQKLQFTWRYAVNGGTAASTGAFCVSSTTTNNYANIAAYQNIQLRAIVNTNCDQRLQVVDRNKMKIYIRKYNVQTVNGAFNTAGVDKFTCNTKNMFATRNNVENVYVWAETPNGRTAYNSAANGVVYSLPENFGLQLRYATNIMVNYINPTSDLIARRRYDHLTQYNNWSSYFNPNVLTVGNSWNQSNIIVCYVDLQYVPIADGHEVFDGGINSQAPWEFDIVCGSAGIDPTNTNMNFALTYVEVIDLSGVVPVVLSTPILG